MTNKKWMPLAVCAGLAVTATACASSGETPKEGAATSAPPASTQTSSQASSSPADSGPKPELKTLNIWMKDDYNTYTVAKLIEEKTGYKVKYDMLPSDKPMDKLNLLIASAEPYDAITVSNEKAIYTDYANKGALVDLTPLIDKYGPNIKASVSKESFDAVTVNGKIYAIPNRSSEFSATSLLIRTDWLEKVGMEIPTTLDELTQVLKAFKEKDPGGMGDKGSPMTIQGSGPIIDNIIGAFGLPNHWNEANGKLVQRPVDPGFKEYLTYVSDLYKQGLLDKEFAVNKDTTKNEKFTSGRAGIIPAAWYDVPSLGDALTKNFPDAKYAYIPALKGKDGKMGLSASSGFDRLTFIPKSAKHPEDAIKWMNAKLEKETFKLIAIGEEGKHYTHKDGAYTPILPIFTDERNNANNYLMGIDEKLYPSYWQARVKKDPRLDEAFSYLNKTLPAEARVSDPMGMAPALPVTAKTSQALGQMITDFAVKVIVGGSPVSSVDEFITKYNAAGGEESSKEVNGWYASKKK